MTEKRFVKIYNTNEVVIDCVYCTFHSYNGFGDNECEICEKGHMLYPNNCNDFKIEGEMHDWKKIF